ncbi:MAG TPA: copper resistance CopC family protein [Micromonosporaceae bacterium]|jgi:hypothetical protein
MVRATLAVVAGALGALLVAAPAWAHNTLLSSDPPNGARLARAPAEVRLTFVSRLDPRTTEVTLTGPDGSSAAASTPVFDNATVRVPLRPGAAGVYTVAYAVMSDDGHPVQGQLQFTLTTRAAGAAPSASSPASSSVSSRAPASASAAAPAAARTAGGPSWLPWVVGAGAVALIAAGVSAAVARRPGGPRRPSAEP